MNQGEVRPSRKLLSVQELWCDFRLEVEILKNRYSLMTEMFGEAWSPMSVPDLAPDDDDDSLFSSRSVIKMQILNEVG